MKYKGEFSIKNIQYKGANKFIINTFSSNKLFVLNIVNSTIEIEDSIEIQNVDINKIQGFNYINDDSIFVLLGTKYEDTALVLINIKGKVLRNNYLHNPSIYKMYSDYGFYPLLYFFNNLVYLNGIIPFPVYYVPFTRNKFASESFMEHKTPLVAFYDLKSDSLMFVDKIWYPFIKKDLFYPDNCRYISLSRTFDYNLLITYPYSLTFQIYDFKFRNIISKKLETELFDSIIPSVKPITDPLKSLDFKLRNVLVDDYTKQYYFFIGTSRTYEYKNILVITDNNFDILGETFFPKISSNVVFTKDYIYSFDYNYNTDSVIVDVFKKPIFHVESVDSIKNIMIRIKEKNEQMLGEEKCIKTTKNIENNSKFEYFRKLNIPDSSFFAICLYNNVCNSCYNYVLKNLSINYNYYKKYPIYLIIQGDNTNQIRYQLKMEGLSNFKRIYIDSLFQYERYDPYPEKSTRLVGVNKNKIFFDKNYLPGFQKDLFENLDSLLKNR
ncbi:MAG: hypothetical protein GYA62_09980 [Bacteroidales bacterium]|nr:hypothetical protein [Bacteroidales bacterium]